MWGAIAMAGASLLAQHWANEENKKEAEKNRKFQEGQTATAVQRRVHDLRAAGLNPILGVEGASSGSGSQAQVGDYSEGLNKGLATAIAIKQQKKDFELKDQQIANVSADTANKNATAELIRNQSASTAMDVKMKSFQAKELGATLEMRIKKAVSEGKYSEAKQIMDLINSGASSASQMLPSILKAIPDKK